MRHFTFISILTFFGFSWILLSPFSAFSPAAYYVSTTGSDTNPGKLSQPFRTIQKCATVAVAGDTCYVRAGTYRETVIPAYSGTAGASITFTPYQGESVTISGTEVISDWTVHSGAIHKSGRMTWDLGVGQNQVFVDGQMMIEARWPNTSLDVSNPVWAVADQGQGNGTGNREPPTDEIWVLWDSHLTHPTGLWDGATIHFISVNESISVTGWFRQSGTVTRQTQGKVEFDPFTTRYGPRAGTRYYLTGKFAALDTGGEWFQQGNTLYLWTPQGDKPSAHVIEAKKRSYAFDFSDRSYITIEGFKIFAAGINMNGNTSHVVIDGIRAKYTSHFTRIINPRWPGIPQGSLNYGVGILLDGKNNTLQNSEVLYSAGSGVDVIGSDHKVHNCIIHDTDYTATASGAISTTGRYFPGTRTREGPSVGHEITHNTLYNTSASVLQHSGSQSLKILNNHMYNAGLQTTDNGITYAARTDGAGTVIAYNWMHDHKASGGIGNGIYLDNSSSNFILHHNVIWNIPEDGIFMVYSDCIDIPTHNWNVSAYNNTFWNVGKALGTCPSGASLRAFQTYNNLSNRKSFLGDRQRNNLIASSPGFVDPANGDFRLQSGSPAIDRGRVISGITDGYVGAAPDIGAYEFGAPAWTAGANPK